MTAKRLHVRQNPDKAKLFCLMHAEKTVWKNAGCSLIDIGDGVLIWNFIPK